MQAYIIYICSYLLMSMIVLPTLGHFVGIGWNHTPSQPLGLYFYYPIGLDLLKREDLVAIKRGKVFWIKRIGGLQGNFLWVLDRHVYVCQMPYFSLLRSNCRELGVCLVRDKKGRKLDCQHWLGYRIPSHFYYLYSNRVKHSLDSRYIGLVNRQAIIYRVISCSHLFSGLFNSFGRYKGFKLIHLLFKWGVHSILFLIFILISGLGSAYAVLSKTHYALTSSPEKGFWFYEQKKVTTDTHACQGPGSWDVYCGFINPKHFHLTGKLAYQFEQHEYHALLQDFSLHPNRLQSVLHWHQFNQWVIEKATQAAYMSEFLMTQYPSKVGETMRQLTLSHFGRLALQSMHDEKESQLFRWLSTSSALVYFKRSSCVYCRQQSPLIKSLSNNTGLSIWEVSLDHPSARILEVAKRLQINSTPTLFLYFVPYHASQMGVWIRVANGLTSEQTLKQRIMHFVIAYRRALIEGIHTIKK